MSLLAPLGSPLGLGGGGRLLDLSSRVRVGLRGDRVETLADLRARLEAHGARIRLQVPAILNQEMTAAVKRIKVRSPVRTGAFRDGWAVEGAGWAVAAVNGEREPPASYAPHVHKKGERGKLFLDRYAIPEIIRARARAVRRLRVLLREIEKPPALVRALVPGGRLR
jgi:hypothetical protein